MISDVLVLVAVCLLTGGVGACSIIAAVKYGRLLEHFHQHHSDKYEQVGPERVLGMLYHRSSGGKAYRYARDHEPLDDEVAEDLLADYARFVRLSTPILAVAFLLLAGLVLFIVSDITAP